ncbi:hypothetical protein SUNI508_11096 [Seiridium unicorne]|uniref:Glycosyltransferase family 31 protein n=1 Tax=Seiridium unicorne TaxID=138068 RepID=A0ABR2UJ48_9PEZI
MLAARRLSGSFLVLISLLVIIHLASHQFGTSSPYYRDGMEARLQLLQDSFGKYRLEAEHATAFNSTPAAKYFEVPTPTAKDPACAWIPNTSKILLIMKTGASESFNMIPTQLITALRCVVDFLIFSDMKQTIAGVDIHDSLETVLQEAMENNADFDLYRRQNDCIIDQENCNKEADGSLSSAGWNLDKYKNVHIAERAYDLRPGYDWYVTIDADTYVLWPNLVQWLAQLDASEKHYLGSATMMNDLAFGHGGSGYVLSGAVMEEFAGNNPGIASQYDLRAKETCCGDYMFGRALKDTIDVGIEDVWPTINGEKPFTLPFGPTEWCHPVVTMHHMNSEEISSFWEFEKQFYEGQEPGTNRTLLLKDIYKHFVEPKLEARRDDWDNLSEDMYFLDPNAKEYESWQLGRTKMGGISDAEKNAHKSFDDCAKMCNEVDECFQFRFQDGICSYQRGFLLGKPRRSEDDESKRWMSGWAVDKIKAWVDEHKDCERPLWPTF